MNVIMSIKPKWADKILSGEKTVEFRKTVFKKDVDKVYIYSSSPVKKIVGYFCPKISVHVDDPGIIFKCFQKYGCITEKEFYEYFGNNSTAYAILIKNALKFNNPIDPYKSIENFRAPQSFMYIDCDIDGKIK